MNFKPGDVLKWNKNNGSVIIILEAHSTKDNYYYVNFVLEKHLPYIDKHTNTPIIIRQEDWTILTPLEKALI
jgi:hypothetical protein